MFDLFIPPSVLTPHLFRPKGDNGSDEHLCADGAGSVLGLVIKMKELPIKILKEIAYFSFEVDWSWHVVVEYVVGCSVAQ